jgi:hypothetical protein
MWYLCSDVKSIENLKGRDSLRDIDIDGRIIETDLHELRCEVVRWTIVASGQRTLECGDAEWNGAFPDELSDYQRIKRTPYHGVS